MEQWSTDDLLDCDAPDVVFGHVNRLGAVRPLPAVVLASVCGYVDTSGTYTLTREELESAVSLLTPAEAVTHIPHPNLWAWRTLLADASEGSSFYAYFLAAPTDTLEGTGAREFANQALRSRDSSQASTLRSVLNWGL